MTRHNLTDYCNRAIILPENWHIDDLWQTKKKKKKIQKNIYLTLTLKEINWRSLQTIINIFELIEIISIINKYKFN